ncbi:hypothetical protein [Nostoc sp. LPT]|uniref:hypothetical protein n=1 Tax=Nostoc sp. LPT TaxID=2815387 RepID=UPI001DAA4D47|nr:hypothetical protein [Nostoc sp. LPT]MBN4002090.1 hypothetical protein [Nostoc sp. LPT]
MAYSPAVGDRCLLDILHLCDRTANRRFIAFGCCYVSPKSLMQKSLNLSSWNLMLYQ